MRLDEKWIRAHLPPDCADESIDIFSGYYLDGLTVMSEGERGGSDTAVYRAQQTIYPVHKMLIPSPAFYCDSCVIWNCLSCSVSFFD